LLPCIFQIWPRKSTESKCTLFYCSLCFCFSFSVMQRSWTRQLVLNRPSNWYLFKAPVDIYFPTCRHCKDSSKNLIFKRWLCRVCQVRLYTVIFWKFNFFWRISAMSASVKIGVNRSSNSYLLDWSFLSYNDLFKENCLVG
jgi:hypothetical protein